MSSDDYYMIRKRDGRYAVDMGFASDEDTPEAGRDGIWFRRLGQAVAYARERHSEYGPYFDSDCQREIDAL